MKQANVQIGGIYTVKVGGRLCRVTVLRKLDGRGRSRFECRSFDTGRTITATAARLREETQSPRAKLVPPSAIPGVRLNTARVIERMERFNSSGIMRFTDRLHVGLPLLAVCREFTRSVGRKSLRDFAPAFRRGALHCLLSHHTYNQKRFVEVMGQKPLPTEEMIAAALLGNAAARAAVLAG
jgi:hypothetical protein